MGIGKNIDTILFDLDGTIFSLNINWPTLKSNLRKKVSKNIEYSEMLELTKNKKKHGHLEDIINSAELEGVKNGHEIEGASAVLNRLKDQYKIAIVTRNSRATAEESLKAMGLEYPPIIAREDVEKVKPNPESLLSALKILATEPDKAIMVGDTFHDINAAHEANMQCVIVKNPNNDYVPEGGDYYIEALSDLEALLITEECNNENRT